MVPVTDEEYRTTFINNSLGVKEGQGHDKDICGISNKQWRDMSVTDTKEILSDRTYDVTNNSDKETNLAVLGLMKSFFAEFSKVLMGNLENVSCLMHFLVCWHLLMFFQHV